MVHRRLCPNSITCNAVISACEKGFQWAGALWILSAMQESGPEPDTVSYNAAISACEKRRYWEKSVALLHEMKDKGYSLRANTCSAAIFACSRGQRWEAAVALFSEMRKHAVLPDVSTHSHLLAECEQREQVNHETLLLTNFLETYKDHGSERWLGIAISNSSSSRMLSTGRIE
eukprot:TRINITY_DN41306_c0_g1_i1.p1 TRINITY_DN41306_c0_g1~~TRINITY_DN41306_c0_g1_i1.p1  ORF type:complete len:187 (+),score=10.58 TRINITY_DN41306_c0_g1_i1:42-563(+)